MVEFAARLRAGIGLAPAALIVLFAGALPAAANTAGTGVVVSQV